MKHFSSEAMEATPAGASRRGFLGLLGGAILATGATISSRTVSAAPLNSASPAQYSSVPSLTPSTTRSASVVAGRGIFTMLDHLSLDAFSGQLNTQFQVPDANIALELTKVRDTSRGDNVRSFQLILRGPLEPVLTPDTHLLRHAAMGDMALFISPFKQDEDGTLYHISFSQLID